jgi:hypothetical protein
MKQQTYLICLGQDDSATSKITPKTPGGWPFPLRSQVGTCTVSANQDHDCGTLSRSAGFLSVFFLVKALTNINPESRTWLIPLKWLKNTIG